MRWLAGLHCRRVRKRRWRYLDNTLSARERAWVDRHLERCIGCRAEFARAAFALESLQKGLPLEANLLPPRSKRWRAVIPPFAALLVLAGSLWLMRFDTPSPVPSPQKGERDEKLPLPAEERVGVRAFDRGGVAPPYPYPLPLKGERGNNLPLSSGERVGARGGSSSAGNLTRRVGGGAKIRAKAQSTKRQLARKKAVPPSKPSSSMSLPEGAIEVYDESGQLVKRDQMRGTR